MDTKVVLTIFGVVLIMAAVFFFFKSFASHEKRMQDEQRARLEMERKQLEDERAAGNRPLTPEEIAQRKQLEEARLKTEAVRKAAAEAARKAAEAKRLQDQIEYAKRQAEDEKRRLEELAKAEKLKQEQVAEAARRAEEERKQAAAAAQAKALECDALNETSMRATRAVMSALATCEQAVQNIENQQKAARVRIEVMTRQLAVKQQLVNSIPVDMRYYCPSMTCGKFPPTALTAARTCTYCRTALQQKDWNQQRREAATTDLNKTQQALALEQQRAQSIPQTGGQNQVALYQAQKEQLENTRKIIADIKAKLGGESPNLMMLDQELQRCKNEVSGVLAALPEDLMRIAQAPAAPTITPPAAPKKVYKLKDGRSIEVASEMSAGEDVILKTVGGEMVTVKRAEIESADK